MKSEKDYLYVKVDSRNRITIPKVMLKGRDLSRLYKIYEQNGNIVLEPIKEN